MAASWWRPVSGVRSGRPAGLATYRPRGSPTLQALGWNLNPVRTHPTLVHLHLHLFPAFAPRQSNAIQMLCEFHWDLTTQAHDHTI